MFNRFDDVFILDGVRTPMVDYLGAFADANPIDLGIKAAQGGAGARRHRAAEVDSVLTGNMAPGGFDQFYVARHIGLYAGVPVEVPALKAQRICGTGFELFRQAGEQITLGCASLALVVGTESMTRNPIAAFDHRGGFRLGAPVGFKDYMWEALTDPAAVSMIQTAENLARQYGITRVEVDAFASQLVRAGGGGAGSGLVRRRDRAGGQRDLRAARATSRAPSAWPARRPWPTATPTRGRRRPRCWPSCARCSRTACRPAATARH